MLKIGDLYAHEWLSRSKEDFEYLAAIAERQGDVAAQQQGVHAINSARARRALELSSNGKITLEAFPLAISGNTFNLFVVQAFYKRISTGRNQVIVGDFATHRRKLGIV